MLSEITHRLLFVCLSSELNLSHLPWFVQLKPSNGYPKDHLLNTMFNFIYEEKLTHPALMWRNTMRVRVFSLQADATADPAIVAKQQGELY